MAEAGGTSTQAGIRYQNSIAALHLGRMLDTRARGVGGRVTSVRVEAPEHVDDIVIRHADGASRYIQAKLNLRQGEAVWDGLWHSLSRQLATLSDVDRLGLTLGDPGSLATNLRECTLRTDGADASEWRGRLNVEQNSVIDAVEAILGYDDAQALLLFKRIDVEIVSEPMLERDLPPIWMPNVPEPARLHELLRDLAGGGARTRAVFDAAGVRHYLRDRHGIDIPEPESWGSQRYRTAVSATLQIAVPGTSIVRMVADGFIWPTATRPAADRKPDFDDEWGRWRSGVEPDGIDLSTFPSLELDKLVVVAGPGFGKSTLLLALTARVISLGLLPVLITAPDLSNSDLEVAEHIQAKVNGSYSVSIDWRHAADTGLVVLLVDGLDEVGADRRSVILDRLRRYSAVYPSVDWVLTVRDAAALSTPTEAKLVELLPLSDDAVRHFVSAYCPDDEDIHRRLHALFESQPEMRRLSRIPLFLTMLLATIGRTGRIPKNRTGVIENYLALLWDPARFKPSDRIATDPTVMRDVAQRAAFEALEKGEIGVSQRLLERMLPTQQVQASSRTVIEDLVKCGVLRRPEPSRYEFPFPIVQEYLAGCHLVEERANDIPRRLAALAKRPWAQAIQFALERHHDPAGIVDKLLDQPDDAFDTHMRLLGRCVVNGMKVTAKQRETITLRLLGLWDPDRYWSAQAVGNLIADGFAKPLAPELRERLFERRLLYSGSGRILCELADTSLTLEILRLFLSEGVALLLNLSEFQSEVDRIGREAFPLYIRAARVFSEIPDEIKGIATLIGHLSAANVDQKDVLDAVADDTLPVLIRTTALAKAQPGQPVTGAEILIRETLRETAFNVTSIAAAASLRGGVAPHTMIQWAQEVESTTGPQFIGEVISGCEPGRRWTLIEQVLSDSSLANAVREHALVFAMSFGSEEAFDELLKQFGNLKHEVVAATSALLGHFPTLRAAARLKAALEVRSWDAIERRSISSSLYTGLTGRLEIHSFSSGSMKATKIHPGSRLLTPLLSEWSNLGGYEACDALRMTLDLVRLGEGKALAEVRPRLAAALAAPKTGERDIHFQDYVIGNAVEILQDKRDPLTLGELEEIARTRTYNARSSALRAIAWQGTTEACDSLMGLYSELTEAPSKDSLLNALQTLASQLGLRVTVARDRLTINAF